MEGVVIEENFRRLEVYISWFLVRVYFFYSLSHVFSILTRRDCEVVDFTRSCVKIISELTNLMKMYRIEGYNGK